MAGEDGNQFVRIRRSLLSCTQQVKLREHLNNNHVNYFGKLPRMADTEFLMHLLCVSSMFNSVHHPMVG